MNVEDLVRFGGIYPVAFQTVHHRLGKTCRLVWHCLSWHGAPLKALTLGLIPRSTGFRALALAIGLLCSATAALAAGTWGTYLKPFSAQSPWNARPVSPVLGDFEIPRSDYFPALVEGKWSTGVFEAAAGDQPVTVGPLPGRSGVWDPDAEEMRANVVIPRWPAGVIPASGSDGHADIVDSVSGVVHSFFQLKNINGSWRAEQYAWSRINGSGWGEPGHYFQGARAAGVPAMGGLIRKHEVEDGDTMYRHALAMSLTFNGLASNPAYVFPATSADTNAVKDNTGRIPEGALLMLPPNYDTAAIQDARLRKVAETLKVFGAYVVDRNHGTPYAIYVENGTNLNLHGAAWNNNIASALDSLRAALRQVVKVDGWLDGNSRPMKLEQRLNLLSMRGPWKVLQGGGPPAGFDTWRQAVVFPAGRGTVVQANTSGRGLNPVAWAVPQAGAAYRLVARASGGGTLRLQLLDASRQTPLFDSGELADGQAVDFKWPQGQGAVTITVRGGSGETATFVSGTLVATSERAVTLAR